jgi:hypothetical protein
MKQWLPMNHQRQPPLITTAAHLANHHSTPQLRGSYGAHGYGCLFSESSLIPGELQYWLGVRVSRCRLLTTTSSLVIPSPIHKGKYCMINFIQY